MSNQTRSGGKHIKIPVIEETSRSLRRYTCFNGCRLEGRPTKVLKRFIDLGFEQGWWDDKLFENLVVFGWDRKYLRSDAGILTLPFKYFLKDMDWTKKRRLEEVDKNGIKSKGL